MTKGIEFDSKYHCKLSLKLVDPAFENYLVEKKFMSLPIKLFVGILYIFCLSCRLHKQKKITFHVFFYFSIKNEF